MSNVEQRTADTVLETPTRVSIGGKEYEAAPPTLATLIEVSRIISTLPETNPSDPSKIVEYSLAYARHCKPVALIIATLVLGAVEAEKTCGECLRRWPWNRKRRLTRAEKLAGEIAATMSPSQLHALSIDLLKHLQLADFFALTTFLNEINMLKPTRRKVETAQIASGQL